ALLHRLVAELTVETAEGVFDVVTQGRQHGQEGRLPVVFGVRDLGRANHRGDLLLKVGPPRWGGRAGTQPPTRWATRTVGIERRRMAGGQRRFQVRGDRANSPSR